MNDSENELNVAFTERITQPTEIHKSSDFDEEKTLAGHLAFMQTDYYKKSLSIEE
jgi:hypothetical protein